MSTDTIVRVRIDEAVKTKATAALAAMGLTVSDALRLMMIRIASDEALPFEPLPVEPLNPNEDTIEAMEATRRGELISVGSPDNLLASLNAED